MSDDSVPCLKCHKPTGMPPLDPRTVPPGCSACLTVVCAECRRAERPLREWHSTWKHRPDLKLVPADLRELEPRDHHFLRTLIGDCLDQAALDKLNAYFVREKVNARARMPSGPENRQTCIVEPIFRDVDD